MIFVALLFGRRDAVRTDPAVARPYFHTINHQDRLR
jgi:hypothetical protein